MASAAASTQAPAYGPERFKLAMEEFRKTGMPMMMAEGFVFELERRGYVQMGPWSPASVLKCREAYKQLHLETLNAGTDIVVACTYYAHKEKLRIIDATADLETINRTAIEVAKEAAMEVTGGKALIAGNICNTNIFEPGNPEKVAQCREIIREQVEIAAKEGVDLVLGETFNWAEEALIATEEIKRVGLPAVINMALFAKNNAGQEDRTNDGATAGECMKQLLSAGADVVGFNCWRGPKTTLPLIKQAMEEGCPGPFAAVPMGYRTCNKLKTVWQLESDELHFPGLEKHLCDRNDWAQFAVAAKDFKDPVSGANAPLAIIGTCCGGWVHHVRAMNEAMGRTVPSSRFSPDMAKHTFLGTSDRLGSQMNRIRGEGGVGEGGALEGKAEVEPAAKAVRVA